MVIKINEKYLNLFLMFRNFLFLECILNWSVIKYILKNLKLVQLGRRACSKKEFAIFCPLLFDFGNYLKYKYCSEARDKLQKKEIKISILSFVCLTCCYCCCFMCACKSVFIIETSKSIMCKILISVPLNFCFNIENNSFPLKSEKALHEGKSFCVRGW